MHSHLLVYTSGRWGPQTPTHKTGYKNHQLYRFTEIRRKLLHLTPIPHKALFVYETYYSEIDLLLYPLSVGLSWVSEVATKEHVSSHHVRCRDLSEHNIDLQAFCRCSLHVQKCVKFHVLNRPNFDLKRICVSCTVISKHKYRNCLATQHAPCELTAISSHSRD